MKMQYIINISKKRTAPIGLFPPAGRSFVKMILHDSSDRFAGKPSFSTDLRERPIVPDVAVVGETVVDEA